jgi:hypothetical protein
MIPPGRGGAGACVLNRTLRPAASAWSTHDMGAAFTIVRTRFGPPTGVLTGLARASETEESRDEESRLKAGCSQDWLLHKASG